MCDLAGFCYPDFFATPSTLSLKRRTGWATKGKYETAADVLGQDSPMFILGRVPNSDAWKNTAREHSLCQPGTPTPTAIWPGEPVCLGESLVISELLRNPQSVLIKGQTQKWDRTVFKSRLRYFLAAWAIHALIIFSFLFLFWDQILHGSPGCSM